MMMYEGLCFAQWSMTLMSNAPFGRLASLHFSAFALMCTDWNIKRTYGRRRGVGEKREGKHGFGVSRGRGLRDLQLAVCMFCTLRHCV